MIRAVAVGLLVAAGATLPAPAAAQRPEESGPPQLRGPLVPGDTVLATPTGRYPAGPIHRWVLGDGHRELWATPVPAPVLDLGSYAGGLTPLRLGGGQQTTSLRLRGADGLVYNFRSIDKDVSRGLDPVLRETLAADVMQDQIAALFPLSAMVVAPLLDAAGLLHPDPRLVVMPDDPALGSFRERFAGMLGWIELRPDEGEDGTPGFAGSRRVVGTDRLFERLEEEPDNRVDDRAFLRARLVDFLVGDWDRHPDQWRWAGFETAEGLTVFQPVPRDRDWALSRLDGTIATFTWIPWPQYVGFSYDFPRAFRQSWNGRGLDRRLLSALDEAAVVEVARDLQARLDDRVLGDAVAALPAAYRSRVGDELAAALRNRRDGLVEMARSFYRLHAGWVDVDVTDEAEVVEVEREADGRLRVRVAFRDPDIPGPQVHYRRTFVPGETREVRLYLHGGDDRAVIAGSGPASIAVRVVGGGGADTLEDRTSGRAVHLYAEDDDDVVRPAPGTGVDRREWDEPETPESVQHMARPRDWGSRWIPLPRLSYDPDLGLFVGAGARRTAWGFRHFPYESRVEASLGITTATGRPRLQLHADLPAGTEDLRARIDLRLSGAEATRYFGLGNETRERPEEVVAAERQEYSLRTTLAWRPSPSLTLEGGGEVVAVRPYANRGTVVAAESPYGYRDFEEAAVVGRLAWDGRDDPVAPRRGAAAELRARWVPGLLDPDDGYGSMGGEATVHLSADGPRLRPSLALRVGGEVVGGAYPWFSAAYLGGARSLRGYSAQRFAGDGALFGSAELRVFLTDFLFVLPGRLGATGLADVGRVWLEGEGSERWHPAVGGGLWATWIDTYTASLSVARSPEETSVYLRLGLPF